MAKVKHHMPSDTEVRERIEKIGNERYRNAFKYQLLIAGRISEVCGKYAPLGIDAFEVKFGGVPAVLFAVQTAKRRGKLRACAMPLNPLYEPWTQELLDYFKKWGDKHPFVFAENLNTSKRYMMWAAKAAFEGLEWPMINYTRSTLHQVKQSQILDERINEKNKEVYLLELEEGKPKWYSVIDGKNHVVNLPVKVQSRWKAFTSHALRKRRTLTLKLKHRFDGFDLSAFGGWTEKSQVDALPGALKHYLYIDVQEADDSLELLKDMASVYFPKLFT